ncbi:hypothetical protein COOONC_00956, partial [Cooperia oncophora]
LIWCYSRENVQQIVPEPVPPLPFQSLLLPHVNDEVKKEKKQREKKVKQQKDRRKKQPEENEVAKKEREALEQLRLAEERLELERAEQRRAEERARLHLLELARDTATPPMRQDFPEAPTPHAAAELQLPEPSPIAEPKYDNDSDTIPFFDDAVTVTEEVASEPLETTFPLNISVDEPTSPQKRRRERIK